MLLEPSIIMAKSTPIGITQLNDASVVAVKLQLSDAVNKTVTSPHMSADEKLLLQTTAPPQTSDNAFAPPFDASQALRSSSFPKPSHTTVRFEAGRTMDGPSECTIVKVAVVVFKFPHSSVAVNETTALPVAPQSLLKAE
jgi:hypothetical protein